MSAKAPASAAPDPSPADRFRTSVDHLRGTAKWTLLAYAAVGGILVAGSQLSSIGSFGVGDARLWVAVIAAAVALSAVAVAVYFIVGVQTAGHVTLEGLVAQEKAAGGVHPLVVEDPTLLNGWSSIEELRLDYQGFIDDYYRLGRIDDNPAEAKVAGEWIEYLGRITDQLLAAARYADVSAAFSGRVRTWLLVASVAAAVAIGVFAWAANPPPDEEAAAQFAMPAPGRLVLGPERTPEFLPTLGGESCAAETLDVIVLGVTDTSADVVVPNRPGCPVVRLTVPREAVVAAQPVAVEATPEATPASSL